MNLRVGSSKPSTFSRTLPAANRPLSLSSVARAGLFLNTNSGSFGFFAKSAFTKGPSIVVLCPIGWHDVQVRPLPPNVSRAKISPPAQMRAVISPVMTRGSCAQALNRSFAVRALEDDPMASGSK